MFWNDVSDIKRATLDGNQRTVIIDSLGPLEEDFDLDRQNQRIFWLSTFDVIYSADYNGTNRKSLVHLILSFATGLAFSHPYLYFTDNNGLHKVNASTGEIVANYSAVRGKPYGVASFNSSCPRSGELFMKQLLQTLCARLLFFRLKTLFSTISYVRTISYSTMYVYIG